MKTTSVQARISCSASAIIFAAALLGGCQRRSEPKTTERTAAKPPEIIYCVVHNQLIERTVSLPATIESFETAMLMARVEAYVGEVLVDIGDDVLAGQVLVRLIAPELEQQASEQRGMIDRLTAADKVLLAELDSARSHLEEVRSQLALKHSERDRLEQLVRSGAIARQRLVEAESAEQAAEAMLERFSNEVKVAEAKLAQGESEMAIAGAKLEQAETMAGYLELKAPFAGVVAQRNIDPGNLVRPASQDGDTMPLLTISKIDKLRAVVYATTDLAGQMASGNRIEFVADNLRDRKFSGTLSRMAGTYNQKTRKMRGEIDLDNAVEPGTGRRALHAGGYGTATVVLESATMPVVPESALRKMGRQTSVVVVSDGVCLVTPVEVGIVSGKMVGIASGIMEGDQVVVQNPEAIQNEQRVAAAQMKLEK